MTVYVDNARIPFRNMLMSHMIADSTEELDAMADRIGVARKWRQQSGTYKEHYDICVSKRALAIKAGAQQLTAHALAEMVYQRRRGDQV